MPSTLANLEPTVREAQRFLGKLGEDIYQVPPDIGDTTVCLGLRASMMNLGVSFFVLWFMYTYL